MRKRRVCIYGGTDLPDVAQAFIARLTYEVLRGMPSEIVTGGFVHFKNEPHKTSTDSAALEGARKYAAEHGVSPADCFSAWLPKPDLDRREKGGIQRMREADGVNIRWMGQRSAFGRRLAMVHEVDMVVTIAGKRHTNEILEQALELDRPALPLPFCGGDSKDFWDEYVSTIINWFSLSPDDVAYLGALSIDSVNAHRVAAIANKAKIGRCLVLLPYDNGVNDEFYNRVVRPAVESVMMCDRLDHRPSSEAIRASFVTSVERARSVIADVTEANVNVMYEVGYALAKGVRLLLFTRVASVVERLPVYLRDLNIASGLSEEELAERIKAHLTEVRSLRPGLGSTPKGIGAQA